MKRRRRKFGMNFIPFQSEGESFSDSEPLTQEVSERFRDTTDSRENNRLPTDDWSMSQDRGEDLADMKDPFIQQPERDTQTPPELTQGKLRGMVGQNSSQPENAEDLAHLFDRERKSLRH